MPVTGTEGAFPSGLLGTMGGGGAVAPGNLPEAALVRRRTGFAGRAEKKRQGKIDDPIRRGVCA